MVGDGERSGDGALTMNEVTRLELPARVPGARELHPNDQLSATTE